MDDTKIIKQKITDMTTCSWMLSSLEIMQKYHSYLVY